jgi:hypothetical protein
MIVNTAKGNMKINKKGGTLYHASNREWRSKRDEMCHGYRKQHSEAALHITKISRLQARLANRMIFGLDLLNVLDRKR